MSGLTWDELPDIMTVEEMRQYMRYSKGTAYRSIKRPGFPVIIDGKTIRIPKKALKEYLEKRLEEDSV